MSTSSVALIGQYVDMAQCIPLRLTCICIDGEIALRITRSDSEADSAAAGVAYASVRIQIRSSQFDDHLARAGVLRDRGIVNRQIRQRSVVVLVLNSDKNLRRKLDE